MKQSLHPKVQQQLGIALQALRISITLVFIMWALDKVLVPEHATRVFSLGLRYFEWLFCHTGYYPIDLHRSLSGWALGEPNLHCDSSIVRRLEFLFVREVPRSIPQPTNLRGMANACGVFCSTPVREHDIYVLKIQPREVSV